MIQKLLGTCLGPVIAAEMHLRRRHLFITVLLTAVAGFAGLAALSAFAGSWSWWAVLGFTGVLIVATLVGLALIDRSKPDLRELARRIEEKHPDLRAALLAAMDQKPGPGGELGFLQKRLLGEISEHAIKNRWVRQVSEKRLAAAGWGQVAGVIGLFVSLWFLLGQAPLGVKPELVTGTAEEKTPPLVGVEISVTPGDVELEKGSRLVIEATFTGPAPAAALLVHTTAAGETRLPMNVGLDDSVFSALIPKVEADGTYRIDYEAAKSTDFAITTFEFPALGKADATVTPPAYLGGQKIEIPDTRKITVMEGSEVAWRLTVNKPVVAGELFGEDGDVIALTPDPADATVMLASHKPAETQRYRVHLVDDKDRGNQRPPWLTVNVNKNLPPKIKLTFPGRDFEVSALQELPLEAEVWDDVEVLATGMSYTFRGEETEVSLSDKAMSGNETHLLSTLIDVETLRAKERDLITYYFWAEDIDRDGNKRRTASDMFFAEVRLFEEIVREGSPQSGEGSPGGGEAGELIKIQKDIVNAAWKLIRDHESGRDFEALADDIDVVLESQQVVIAKTDETIEKSEDPELREIFQQAREEMNATVTELVAMVEKENLAGLRPAHGKAVAAYAKLIEARAREMEISMSKSQSPSQSQEREQQNMNLELEQKELKYEENSVAQDPAQTAEQKENLAVLSKLKDLARRQEAIAEKIKELENQLQNASEEKKAEIERQLKRLEEEQRELLREVDDLSERMDSEENRANMSEEKEKLDETRENIRETAENLESGELTEATNSATRAQEQLEEMQEEFREKTSRQFAGEMKALRDATRALAEQQEAVGEAVEKMTGEPADQDFDTTAQRERGELAQSLADQARKLEEVVEQMRTLSEQSEVSEPLLSDALYETVRQTMMNQVGESLAEARDLTFYNRAEQAKAAEQAAARGIEELKKNVEAAAEKVLGNEADAMRLARSELDKLIEETKAETDRLGGKEGTDAETNAETDAETREGQVADQTGSGEQKEKGKGEAKGKGKGEMAGEGEDGTQPGEGKGKGPGEMAGTGETPGEGEEGTQPGDGKGKGKGKGQGEGESEAEGLVEAKGGKGEGKGEGEGQGEIQSQAEAKGGKGKGQGQGEGQGEGDAEDQEQAMQPGNGQQRGGLSTGGDDRGGGLPTPGQIAGEPLFFDQTTEQRESGPITGEDYEAWSDRLAAIEEMLPQDDLRNSVGQVRDDARSMRIDFRRDNQPPEAATINQKITEPLIELRQRLSEEIAKLNRENPVAPIDRDPVPSEFRDLVRRYYEELGAGN
jgi:hypothetical protein